MMAFLSCSGTAHSGGGNCQARTITRFLYITAGMTRAQPGPLVTAAKAIIILGDFRMFEFGTGVRTDL